MVTASRSTCPTTCHIAAFGCYLTVSAVVPVITDEPLPLAFLANLIGGALVLALAGFVT
jgi:hypothetical protein